MTDMIYRKYVKKLSFENEIPDTHLKGIKMSRVPLADLNVHITYGICYEPGEKGKETGVPYRHDFDTALLFIGLDTDDMTELGAEIELYLGAEKEKQPIAHASVVAVPKGVPYFPLIVKKLDCPFLLMQISMIKDWQVDRFIPDKPQEGKTPGNHKGRIIELAFRPKKNFYGAGTTADSGGDITIIMGKDLGLDLHISYESIKNAPYVFLIHCPHLHTP